MPIEIISERQRKTETYYELSWLCNDGSSCGFGFSCDKDGNIDESQLRPAGAENLRKLRNGEYPTYVCKGVIARERSWTEPTIGLCDCGQHVELSHFTNTCDKCGRDYNSSGQRLANREQWGEETGEHPCDIANMTQPWDDNY